MTALPPPPVSAPVPPPAAPPQPGLPPVAPLASPAPLLAAPPQPGLPLASPAPPPSALPVVFRAYHEYYRTPRLRWWKPLVALAVLCAASLGAMLLLLIPYALVAPALGEAFDDAAELPATPLAFLYMNLSLAAIVPAAIVAHRLVFGQRAGWLASIQGRFRWRLLGRFLLTALPFYLAWYGTVILVEGADFSELRVDERTVPVILIILLTTPLQCAGEEYALRGLVPRCVGAWFPHRVVGFVVATVVSSVVFMLLHGVSDPWMNLGYLCFAVAGSVLVWRTGGLEAAIALHVVNNMIAMVTVPFEDLAVALGEPGPGSPWLLLEIPVLVATGAAFWWQAKRLGLPTQAAPGAVERPGDETIAAEGTGTRGDATGRRRIHYDGYGCCDDAQHDG